ncbi:hypothetical protein [Salmonella phage vB_SenAc-pSK20]|uniref:Uncharacterized protein n=10 Tax=Caudoviricetes TaxID=2731619 RepID=A0A1W5PUP8_9CAUD|nr:hypothetical protein F371_gp177 [Escherichia phage PhaxI]YP_009140309.1 hypothetical protein DET7_132 [Salmonella phage Det7]YP_009876394.1 hypothetical protein HYP09_gp006 [Salmonella phage BSP101]YP_009966711.1 hypothetical protein HYQ26_gp198 [Salmonella phage Se-G]YP_009966747.1 hypothetical protein HYQ27_gp025 [Salmonella phage Se-J]ANT44585.1 hypothetical protein vB_SenM-2_127 [Salmonella phage vB_SenM-2]APD18339.1 hypothetical protein STP07_072 [Salmonella phage STP07]QIG60444.1 hy
MITAGYTVDLYCECVECKSCNWAWEEHHPRCGMKSYAGESWGDCARQARADGWMICRDKQTCFAPGHPRKSG